MLAGRHMPVQVDACAAQYSIELCLVPQAYNKGLQQSHMCKAHTDACMGHQYHTTHDVIKHVGTRTTSRPSIEPSLGASAITSMFLARLLPLNLSMATLNSTTSST